MAAESVRPCSFAFGECVLKTHHSFQKAVRVRAQQYQKIYERVLLDKEKLFGKSDRRKKSRKSSPKITVCRRHSVIAIKRFRARFSSSEFFQGSGFRRAGGYRLGSLKVFGFSTFVNSSRRALYSVSNCFLSRR